MIRYIDTSVLVAYYLPEPLSERAERGLRRGGTPSISPLVARNGTRNGVTRNGGRSCINAFASTQCINARSAPPVTQSLNGRSAPPPPPRSCNASMQDLTPVM